MKKLIVPACIVLMLCACNSSKISGKDEQNSASTAAVKEIIEVTGKVKSIINGKDGYTATLVTNEELIYNATISIPNMTDPANYRRVAIGESVTVSGELWKIQNENQITVRRMK